VQVESMQVPVNIGQARVMPGDLLVGDADGVVVIPSVHEARVLAAAEEIEAAENAIRAAARSGMRLDEARREHRYHALQTKVGA
jgi:4-hydroxy-4-methyl-2-oxoglutarate aldolase